jgi:CHAD domain-containing protein
MARPHPVEGLDPDRRMRPNARRILSARIAEVYAYDGYIADPANVRELHDMRIAFKRLRYLLEIFGVAFDTDLSPFLDEVKAMQDLLGDIHDRDVQVPMLRDHLEWLGEREHMALRRTVAEAAAIGGARGRRGSESSFRDFRARLDVGLRSDERVGVHGLIARRRQERNELYHRFLDEWRRLKRERFRQRLEGALGIERRG